MVVFLVLGKFIIENVVKEFEIVDLVNYINEMGGKIIGVGIDIIMIYGVEKFYGVEYVIILDRIEVGMLFIVGVIICGDIFVCGVIKEYMVSLIYKFEEMGVDFEYYEEGIRVIVNGDLNLVDVKILLYLGFLIDM